MVMSCVVSVGSSWPCFCEPPVHLEVKPPPPPALSAVPGPSLVSAFPVKPPRNSVLSHFYEHSKNEALTRKWAGCG